MTGIAVARRLGNGRLDPVPSRARPRPSVSRRSPPPSTATSVPSICGRCTTARTIRTAHRTTAQLQCLTRSVPNPVGNSFEERRPVREPGALVAPRPINRSLAKCPPLLGLFGTSPLPGDRCPVRHWRRIGTWDPTFSAPRCPTSTARWSKPPPGHSAGRRCWRRLGTRPSGRSPGPRGSTHPTSHACSG